MKSITLVVVLGWLSFYGPTQTNYGQVDWTCMRLCQEQGMQYGYCISHCSF